MQFIATADTDIGTIKNTNQDSVLIKHASYNNDNEVLMAIVADGMGGLSKGELASATVIRRFSKWFEEELPFELEKLDMNVIGAKWALILKALNAEILEYGKKINESLGTTFTGFLSIDEQYLIVHVGDSRAYKIDSCIKQITTDQTFVAREIAKGTMTPEQAKTDKRRNLLLQCVGASKVVEPQIVCGIIEKGAYMICSDGFRHEITEEEMYESLNPVNLMNKDAMHSNSRYLIEQIKSRGERDNISVALIKVN
ncbi:MAG: protein phosphatase 2C domain-containing protein [Acutalibacteraceae bacterium]|nr:protein phosphatase 2C domain-containing protein [Acutalibacteraceae bacterium]